MPSFGTTVRNSKVANVGTVRISFDDGTNVAKSITSLGDFVFDENSSRQPVQIELLGSTWQVGDLDSAVSITYPNSTTGKMTQEIQQGDGFELYFYYLDEQA